MNFPLLISKTTHVALEISKLTVAFIKLEQCYQWLRNNGNYSDH